MVVQNYKKFLWSIFLFLAILNLLYLVIFDSMVKKDALISSSYQHFLLENRSSPRLIIESGSNSTYGIDSYRMSQALHLQTINLSDNAGYSLKYKLLRLAKYTNAGDIILLPLEWQYYSRQKINKEFSNRIFEDIPYYYNSLRWWNKIALIYKIPFDSLFQHLEKDKKENTSLLEFRRFKQFMQRYNTGNRGAVQEKHEVTVSKFDNYGVENCYDYIFSSQIENGFVISDTFKENVKLIKRLQKKGVKVLVTWASVTGEDCYQKKYHQEIERFSEEVRAFLIEKNIPVVGDIYDSEFSNEYMYNTFYHILHEARLIRTKRLIEKIKLSSYLKWFNKERKIEKNKFETVSNLMKKNIIESMKGIQKSKIVFFLGWYDREAWGRWSSGEHSSLLLFIPSNKKDKEIKIKIKSRIYGENKKIILSMDGKQIGKFNLEREKIIRLPYSTNKSMIELHFDYFGVKSPSEVELNNSDNRKIKLGIESIEIVD